MKPGERIRLIDEAATILSSRPWPKIQLVLRQFEVRTYDPFGGYGNEPDSLEYCMNQLQEATDENIVGIHEFLVGEDAGHYVHPSGSDPWTGEQPARVFLSHVYASHIRVGQVKAYMSSYYGVDAFVAHDNIKPSAAWRAVIRNGLATCDAFVAFLDPGFHESQWCDQEAGWALGRNIPILTIRDRAIDRSEVKDGFLEEHQDYLVDYSTNWAHGTIAWEIFRTVVEDSRTKEVGGRALAEALVKSTSYDSTRKLWPLIAKHPSFETDQLRRLEFAVQTNNQVYDAVYDKTPVTQLVKELVARFEPPSPSKYGDEEPF